MRCPRFEPSVGRSSLGIGSRRQSYFGCLADCFGLSAESYRSIARLALSKSEDTMTEKDTMTDKSTNQPINEKPTVKIEIDAAPKGKWKAIGGSDRDKWNDRLLTLVTRALPVNQKNAETVSHAGSAVMAGVVDLGPAGAFCARWPARPQAAHQ